MKYNAALNELVRGRRAAWRIRISRKRWQGCMEVVAALSAREIPAGGGHAAAGGGRTTASSRASDDARLRTEEIRARRSCARFGARHESANSDHGGLSVENINRIAGG